MRKNFWHSLFICFERFWEIVQKYLMMYCTSTYDITLDVYLPLQVACNTFRGPNEEKLCAFFLTNM